MTRTAKLFVTAGATALGLAVTPATAATNIALAPQASISGASTFLNFGQYNISLVPGGATIAKNNLLTNSPQIFTNNYETRYIFEENDSGEFLILNLGSTRHLTSLGTTWFNATYHDRIPSSVTFSFSNDGTTFGSAVSAPTLPYGGSSDLISLGSPVSAQYVKYSFGGNGGAAISQLFASAVPETATWAMMIIGFGIVGASMRYRRGKASVAFA